MVAIKYKFYFLEETQACCADRDKKIINEFKNQLDTLKKELQDNIKQLQEEIKKLKKEHILCSPGKLCNS